MGKPATIYDVAKRAQVSHITVSRVVNGKANVSEKTREKVLQAMHELGYVQNPIAQTLQTRRSRTIELITTDPWGSRAEAISEISIIAQFHQYQMSVHVTTLDELEGVLSAIPNRMVAGSILYAQNVNLDYSSVHQLTLGHPFVHMGGKRNSPLPSVVYDNYHAVEIAVEHLIQLGHTQIACITGQQELFDGRVRYQAWLDTVRKAGLRPGPVAYGDFGPASGAAATQTLIESREPFTAIFAASDAMATSAIYVLQQHGLRVPDDVSVIGYDNDQISSFTLPPLTTIENDFGQIGRLSVQYLLEIMENPDNPHYQRVLNPELIIRKSTCPPKKA
jgi:LacI family transcriptional regulator